jgi:hypothetical protein
VRAPIAILVVTALASTALAQPPAASPATASPWGAHGRGLVWGASGAVPILLGDVRYAETGARAPYASPGGGVDARVGWELDAGFRLELAVAADGHEVDLQIPLTRYRAGLQARMPIDLGGDVYPFFAVGGALALMSRNGALAATLDVRGLAGLGWSLAHWFALELSVAVDVTPPGFAFTDTVVFVTPMLGVDVSY